MENVYKLVNADTIIDAKLKQLHINRFMHASDKTPTFCTVFGV